MPSDDVKREANVWVEHRDYVQLTIRYICWRGTVIRLLKIKGNFTNIQFHLMSCVMMYQYLMLSK